MRSAMNVSKTSSTMSMVDGGKGQAVFSSLSSGGVDCARSGGGN